MSKQTYNTADYANNIQATINDVPVGGGLVIVAPGAYPITSPIVTKVGITLAATGWRSTRIYATQAMPSLISIAGTAQLSISDVYVRGINLDGANLADWGIDLTYARDANIMRDMFVERCLLAGIATRNGSWINRIENSVIRHCGRGVDLQENSNCLTLLDVQLEYNNLAGVWCYDSYGVRFLACQFSANGQGGAEQYGLFVRGGAGVNVDGGYFEGNGVGEGRNIGIDGGARGVVINGGHFSGIDTITRYALEAYSCANVTMIGAHSERHITATVNAATGAVGVVTCGVHTQDPSIGNATAIW